MKIGIVGYSGSGKSTLFELLSGKPADPAQAHSGQSAMSEIPDARIDQLCKIYTPKKITRAALELVDTPGLSRTHEGNATRLALIREAGALVLVVAGFSGGDALKDLATFEEDCLFADLDIITKRVEKLRDSTKKPRPNREQELAELEALEPLLAVLESGKPLTSITMSEDQVKATRSFRLLTEKPRLIVVNTADDESNPARFTGLSQPGRPVAAAALGLELELSKMPPAERETFAAELGLSTASSRDALIRTILEVSGQMIFFTAGDKEIPHVAVAQGWHGIEAAAGIHNDLARGFIRAEVMTCSDLVRLGSEREIKANNLMRQEHKEYVVKDDDILHIRHNA